MRSMALYARIRDRTGKRWNVLATLFPLLPHVIPETIPVCPCRDPLRPGVGPRFTGPHSRRSPGVQVFPALSRGRNLFHHAVRHTAHLAQELEIQQVLMIESSLDSTRLDPTRQPETTTKRLPETESHRWGHQFREIGCSTLIVPGTRRLADRAVSTLLAAWRTSMDK